ncbi:type IV pilus assembly protein PilC [Desulforamulus putei DSM 12395]|uniref:Type IV pilus assembly protein PilC n=1 Tax=Desulforamulus putei DSM 12395 TaxID=1121429 RepID=A0A1M4UUU5_9FIRM|nr:type II secretion system F family protein [Desulforamulus putei]SHE60464.1 type IV pilus assembly protein PilC [Desulforamulus putei DSM 12395]
MCLLTFKYRARNLAGKVITGKITAPHKIEAINRLRQKNLFVAEIKEMSTDKGLFKFMPEARVSIKDLSLFCRQFATLTNAGIPIIQSLNILYEQTENKALLHAIKDMKKNLEAGYSLSQSMSYHSKIFPVMFMNMVEAGELSGSLDQILDRLATYYENSHELMEKFKSAITYPLFILVMAMVAVAAIFIFVLPTFTQIIIDMQAPIALPTVIMIKISDVLRGYWYVLMITAICLVVGYKKFSSTSGGKKIVDQTVLFLPVYGKLIQQIHIVRFSRTLAILLSSGISLLASLDVMKNHAQNSVFGQAIGQAITSLKEGSGLAAPLQKSEVFPAMVINMIRVGEETGELEVLLEKTANFYEKAAYQTITRLSTLLEPVLICLVGGIVSLIMIAILIPLLSIMDSLQ